MKRQKVQEEELITVDAIGCFEGEEDGDEEEEVEVADEEDSEEGGEADDDPQDLYGTLLWLRRRTRTSVTVTPPTPP